jgi:uncharacterized protein (DUF433 family)
MSDRTNNRRTETSPPAASALNGEDTVTRTERGLVIRGTRLTLYTIMDHVYADWSTERIRDWFRLSDEQINGAMAYIHSHREQVEKEYQEVLRIAEENRRYWEEYNRNRPKPPPLPDTPQRAAVRAKIAEMKRSLGME